MNCGDKLLLWAWAGNRPEDAHRECWLILRRKQQYRPQTGHGHATTESVTSEQAMPFFPPHVAFKSALHADEGIANGHEMLSDTTV